MVLKHIGVWGPEVQFPMILFHAGFVVLKHIGQWGSEGSIPNGFEYKPIYKLITTTK